MSQNTKDAQLTQILPHHGQLIYEEKSELIMCKPRLMPMKSLTLQKLENMQKQMRYIGTDAANTTK